MNIKIPNAILKNSNIIFRAATISGVVTTTGLAISGTVKASKLIDRKYDLKIPEDRKELFKILVKCYWPMVTCGVMTIGINIWEGIMNDKQKMAYAAAAELAQATLDKAEKKLIEKIGPEEADKLIDEVRAEQAIETRKDVPIPGKGNELCYDTVTGQMFLSDINNIRAAQNIINSRYNGEIKAVGYATSARDVQLSEFIELLGENDCKIGEKMGWDPGVWTSTPPLSVDIRSAIVSEKPVLMISYNVYPLDERSDCYA